MNHYDVAIIGAGPGGFEAAIAAREHGLSTAVIEKSDAGGTCLNAGCIPTKSLLATAKLLSQIQRAEAYGLPAVSLKPSLSEILNRKNRIVQTLKKAALESLQRSGAVWIPGKASFVSRNRLSIGDKNHSGEIEADAVVIATGSEPTPFPGLAFDGKCVLSSNEILELKQLPKKLLILGGGVVGVEFASIFHALGVSITLVEMLPNLIATEDVEVSRRLETLFRRKGIEVLTQAKVKKIIQTGRGIEALLEGAEKLSADQILIAIGRRPNAEALNLEKAGVALEKGRICVNEFLQTSAPGIFAVGDVTTRSTGLAHGAAAEGIQAVENILGMKTGRQSKMNYEAIPNCIYTDPEVASCGIYRKTDAP